MKQHQRFITIIVIATAAYAFVRWGAQPLGAFMATTWLEHSATAKGAAANLRKQTDEAAHNRANDGVGQRLARSCADWQKADRQLATPSTHAGAQRACEQYQAYVQAGTNPETR